MQYRKMKKDVDVSLLGYGCMRFSKNGASIDIDKAEKEVIAAIEGGVNYLDTAYVYPGSEAAVGEILSRHPGLRDKVYIATKLPHYLIKSKAGVEKTFNEQLARLKTDHIDYYLMHMLTDVATWEKLIGLGILDWINEKLESGQIRNIGFSYHGNTEGFKKLVDAYDWDFTQIQYNYMDEHSQAGLAGLKYAAEKGLPVVIMEGLRGGRLVNLLPESSKRLIAESSCGLTPAALAFKWLYNQPEVTCVLSGMNSLQMVQENLETVKDAAPGCMTEEEKLLVEKVKEDIAKNTRVGCTGCGYCMPCPRGVDIPLAFRCLNEFHSEGKGSARREYFQCSQFRQDPTTASQCIRCGKCEPHCPQGIPIRDMLKEASSALETVPYRIGGKIIRALKLW